MHGKLLGMQISSYVGAYKGCKGAASMGMLGFYQGYAGAAIRLDIRAAQG